MDANVFRIGGGLLARDADRVFLGLDLQAGFFDSRQFDDRQDVVALLETLIGGKGPGLAV